MAYTFHWGKHGIRRAWSSLSIDYSSPSRKRHKKFWTLNSSNQKWYGEKEIGILLEFLKNTFHIFPFSKPGSLIQSIYRPSSKLIWIVRKAWLWFIVSNKSTIISFCMLFHKSSEIHTYEDKWDSSVLHFKKDQHFSCMVELFFKWETGKMKSLNIQG